MNRSKTWLAFFSGIAIGALTGVLLMPQKGSVTRKKIRKKGSNILEGIGENIENLGDNIKKTFGSTEKGMETKVKKGKHKLPDPKN
jgi:gas vesicle protein